MNEIRLKLSNEDLERFLLMLEAGNFVCGGAVGEEEGSEDDAALFDAVEEAVLFQIHAQLPDAPVKTHEDHIHVSEELEDQVEEILQEHGEGEFWHRLEIGLGQRDFMRTLTEEQREKIEKDPVHELPKEIDPMYEKWSKEFEEFGLDRLEVKE